MPDPSSPSLTCTSCGAAFERANRMGRKPTLCPPCALDSRRRSGLEWARRNTVAKPVDLSMMLTCRDCGEKFERVSVSGVAPSRCGSCQSSRTHAIRMRRQAERRAAERALREDRPDCPDCGAPIPHPSKGPGRVRCEGCQRKHENRHRKRVYRVRVAVSPPPKWKLVECLGCGTSVEVRRGSKRQRCGPCTEARKKYVTKRWAAENINALRVHWAQRSGRRRALMAGVVRESFSYREVFARDRWVCGICSKKIDPKLKFPHPMSVSLDHLVPLSEGGPHTRANSRAAHLGCNCRRAARGGNEQLALIG
jgi:predicted Zn-ribbon and HTH transcriptional regulator